MKKFCLITMFLFLILISSCNTQLSTETNHLTLTPTPSAMLTSIKATATYTSIPFTVTPIIPTKRPSTQTPPPVILPTKTPAFEVFKPITVENSKFAQIVYTFKSRNEIWHLEFSPLGNVLAALNGFGELQMWRFPKEETRIALQDYQVDAFMGTKSQISHFAFSPDGDNIIVWEFWNGFVIRDSATDKIYKRIANRNLEVDDLVYSPDGSILAIAVTNWDERELTTYGPKITIQLWDMSDISLVATIEDFPDWWGTICSLAISSDSKVLAAGFCDYHMRIWDLKNGFKALGNVVGLYSFECPGHCSPPTNIIAFKPNSTILASGTNNAEIPLVDIYSGRLSVKIFATKESDWRGNTPIADIAFSPDGTLLAIAAGHEMIVTSTKTGELLSLIKTSEDDYLNAVSFNPNGLLLAFGTTSGNIYIIGVKD